MANTPPPQLLSNSEIIQIWQKTVEVQMHFNTVSMTVRNIFASLALAVVAAIGLAVKEQLSIFLVWHISLGAVLGLVAVVITGLFYFMDRYWYHRLLVGSVRAGLVLEKHLSSVGPVDINLTGKIGESSPVAARLPKWARWGAWLIFRDDKTSDANPRSRYISDGVIHSEAKISLFYKTIALIFLILSAAAQFILIKPNVDPEHDPSRVSYTISTPDEKFQVDVVTDMPQAK